MSPESSKRNQNLLAAAFAVAAVVAGCSRGVLPAGTPVDSFAARPGAQGYCATAASPSPEAHAHVGAKLPVVGLLDLGQVSAVNMPIPPANTLYYACKVAHAIGGVVVNDTWADLQPNGEGTPIVTKNIDAALAVVARYNATAKVPIRVRLRVWQGIDAPQWAKQIDGPIEICDQNGLVSPSPSPTPHADATPTACPSSPTLTDVRTVGGFWTKHYQRAWANVQRQLAQKYDSNPAVNEVTITSCSSLTAEPFIQPEDGWSVQNLFAAKNPYSNAAYQACLKNALPIYSVWKYTIVDDIFNPFKEIAIKPPYSTDLGFTESLIRDCLAMGSRCLLDNETLGKFGASPPPPTPSPSASAAEAQSYFAMWTYMQHVHEEGALLTFQTAAPPKLLAAGGTNLAGWNIAVGLARQFGAGSLELWPPESTLPCKTPAGWLRGYTCFTRKTVLEWSRLILKGEKRPARTRVGWPQADVAQW